MNKNVKEGDNISWNFYAGCILIAYCFLQSIHWQLLPLGMDIYYHLHTAWGFVQTGGYTGWDFWEYAPSGRPHVYPPMLHLILAFFIKLGISKVVLAKLFQIILPVSFLIIAWYFTRKNYGSRMGLFTLIMLSSSFSFYLSLINHLPSTLALIFGILSLDRLFRKQLMRASILLAFCFYTHIGIPWFFAISFILFSLFDREYRKDALIIVLSAIVLSLPIILKQLTDLKYIKAVDLNEKYLSEFKVIDYALVLTGIISSWKLKGKYALFVSLFAASFIFIVKPYRFFSSEGYLPMIFLSAVSLNQIYGWFKSKKVFTKYLFSATIVFILFVSPTILMEKNQMRPGSTLKAFSFDSVIMGLLFPERNKRVASTTDWFPNEYLPAVSLIQENSAPDDIIYSKLVNISVCLSSLSGRAAANGLLPDVAPVNKFDPLSVSKIFIAYKNDNSAWLTEIAQKYNLTKIGENKTFILYKNPLCSAKVNIKRASFAFPSIILIGGIFVLLAVKPVKRFQSI